MKTNIKLAELAQIYLERMETTGGKNLVSKRTHLKKHIIRVLGKEKVMEMTGYHIDMYKHTRAMEGAKPATVNNELADISHMFTQAVEWRLIKHVPCKIRKNKVQNHRIIYLTSEQVREVIREAKQHSVYMYLFMCIGLYTAMRMGEILRIRWEDIQFEQYRIHIPKAKAGARLQPMPPALVVILEEFKQDSGWVFPAPNSQSHMKNVRVAFRTIVKRAGLDPKVVVRHTLRHTAITHLVQAGVDLPTVKQISGHSTVAMVERYAHANNQHITNAVQKLESVFSL